MDPSPACRATPGGTAGHAARFAGIHPHGYAPLGSTGLTVGRVGFGGYRVDDETPEHRAALAKTLECGANLIDTSTNYTDGGSERLVGSVLEALTVAGRFRREEIVIVSKIGYVQGNNLALAQERERAGRPFPEMVKYTEGCWHCVHPEFLGDQLARSLDRLRLRTLDVCLLHNPEYFLSDRRKQRAGPLTAVRDEFYRRLEEAFRFFEHAVEVGQIGWYGVSSNTATSPAADPEATSLTRMLEAACRAGGEGHHLRVLQLPMNLFEAGGIFERNNGQGERETVLETALREGIGVLTNRPLNAIVGDGLLRLADVRWEAREIPIEPQLELLAELEAGYRREFAPRIEIASRGLRAAEDLFRWSSELRG